MEYLISSLPFFPPSLFPLFSLFLIVRSIFFFFFFCPLLFSLLFLFFKHTTQQQDPRNQRYGILCNKVEGDANPR